MIDRKLYFDAVRANPFMGNLVQQQVDGQEAILAAWEAVWEQEDRRWLAYMLATTYHETAATMVPVEEYGKGAGHTYGIPDPETGETYYGRGLVQLTWRENYQKMGELLHCDLDHHPELALTNDRSTKPIYCASRIMFRGMKDGMFTGRALGDYFNDTKNDARNARQIINGNDKDTLVAGYHDAFLAALDGAYVEDLPEPEPEPPDIHGPDGETVVNIFVSILAPPGVIVNVTTETLPPAEQEDTP